ncbi:MAG: DNA-directed RNA polymerase subunit K [Nitrososphaerota archaeon]
MEKEKKDLSIEYKGLTRYEKARIIGGRALQLSLGAFPLIETRPGDTVIDIAKRELEAGVLPIIIRRKRPDGSYVDIQLQELLEKQIV